MWGRSIQPPRFGWWKTIIFYVPPYLGKWSNLTNIFHTGWNHQPDYIYHVFTRTPILHLYICFNQWTPSFLTHQVWNLVFLLHFLWLPSLKLTAKAPENGWLEYDPFLLGWPIFRGKLLVSGSVFFLDLLPASPSTTSRCKELGCDFVEAEHPGNSFPRICGVSKPLTGIDVFSLTSPCQL